ncbi:hypothetical protein PR202_ga05444 [Eleusine coracana subsp. coracana]|uniref:WRKY domain-containing protein n=1 Tax=Eleusine coracana subsp. coracana TaxID=191504 RepID=A0AAV5BSU1_ELECO|nr:hypothetical protein QOZ80_5AG0369650 [Eleusine coracana subsp. coracana]GJM88870.1 hypothetical protein PR202_ga04991 [Eleusine coracana subsp. coracana]GJM89271.1 hypothetical protein PR202_ga05444 [Eleusine coracana subsp. coracana]
MAVATRPSCAASELIAKGRESAEFLRALLAQQPTAAGDEMPHGIWDLTEQILRCCDRALEALQDGMEDAASDARKRKPEPDTDGLRMTSSKRMRGSGGERGTRVEKKWTMEDGYIWRKYGQKEIRDSKYPRLYFRCTYKEDHGCLARRRVQKSDVDPSVFLITYFGEHTCCSDNNVDEVLAPLVINFGSSSTRDGQPSGSPWPSCHDDGLVVSETSEIYSRSEGEDLRSDKGNMADELMENSTPVLEPETEGMGLPQLRWEPLDGCLDWELGNDILFDFGEFINYDYLSLLQ